MNRIATLVVLLLGVSLALAADVRTWSDASGKFSLQAKFVSSKDGKVTLQKPDGSQFEIELAKLSPADQKYVAEQLKGEDNPFKPKEAATPFVPAGDAAKTIDWAGARLVDPNPQESEWKVPVKPMTPKAGNQRPVSLPAASSIFEKIKGLAFDANGMRAVVAYSGHSPREKTEKTKLYLCDVTQGKVVASVTHAGLWAPLAVHDDGKRVILRSDEFGHGKHDRLLLAALEGAELKTLARFSPYDDLKHGDRDVPWAAFVGSNQMLTVSGGGKLACWNFDALKPDYYFSIQGNCRPALNADRTLLAFSTGKEVGILDVAAGKVLASKSMSEVPFSAFAFSPSGQRLACAGLGKATVWNVATGAEESEMTFAHMAAHGSVVWPTNEHLLVGKNQLIEPSKQVRMWDYHGAEHVAEAGGVCWAAVSEGNRGPGAVLPLKIPHPAAKQALDKALADPEFFILKRGATVSLDVSGLADSSEQEKVRKALAQKLEANSCTVGAGQIKLAASTEVGKERDVTYHTFGVPFGNKTYKVTEHFARLKFIYQDKTVWESSALNIPYFVHLKEGETMQDYLRKNEKPNYKFFETVELPKLLTKPTAAGAALGTSRITASGLK